MRESLHGLTLLSKAQLDTFRAQLRAKHEAAFLAPQLLEHVTILNRELHIATGKLEALRRAAADLTSAYDSAAGALTGTPTCLDDPAVRSAMTRLHLVLHDD